MEVALPRTTAGHPGVIESPARRRAILAVLVLVIVACLGTIAVVVAARSTGDDLGERLSSLQDDDAPGDTVSKNREQLLSISREFATRFNTYDPSMLDDNGHLPAYASVSELMTPKFAGVFDEAIKIPEQTVAQGASSVAIVYAVGVDAQDSDSAQVLVAGTIELSYPLPEQENGGTSDGSDSDGQNDEQRLSTGPQRFRYVISLVKIDGHWLVDDVDDIDDGRPSFSQPAIPEETPTETPSTPPATTPSESATTEPSGEGER
jgi:Mce-associated membrane protein